MNNQIGDRIRAVADAIGLRHNQLARELGVTAATMKNWKGATNVRTEPLQIIVRRWGVCPRWLLVGEGEMFSNGRTKPTSVKKIDSDRETNLDRYSELVAKVIDLEQRLLELEKNRAANSPSI